MVSIALALFLYVVTADWTFEEMRDGIRIGAFPLAYVGLCLIFALWIMLVKSEPIAIPNSEVPSLLGLMRIGALIGCGLGIAFFHQEFGFALLSMASLLMLCLFMGLSRVSALVTYSALVTAVLFVLFTLLGFELSIAPDLGRLGD